MFLYSVMGGILIGIGGIAYLTIGATLGAFCFSIGLISILTFTFNLFTGKAGLLVTKDITIKRLMLIWAGNFVGCLIASGFARQIPTWPQISEKATAIINIRASNSFFTNFFLGILCGLLMYIAVTGFKKTGNSVRFPTPRESICGCSNLLLGNIEAAFPRTPGCFHDFELQLSGRLFASFTKSAYFCSQLRT